MLYRKHFKLIAAEIARLPRIEDRRNIAITLGQIFAGINPEFDQAKFYAAAQINALKIVSDATRLAEVQNV